MGSESGLERSSGLRDLVTEDSHPVGICWSWKMGEGRSSEETRGWK